MSEPEKHPVRNGIVATVVGGALLSALPPVRDAVVVLAGWSQSAIVAVWHAGTSTYRTPGWILLALSLAGLDAARRMVSALTPRAEPDFKRYTEDTLYSLKWRWTWVGNQVSNLWCYCPRCDASLVYDDSSCAYVASDHKTDFICEHCGRKVVGSIRGGDRDYAVSAAVREIQRRIRTNEYQKL